MKQKALNIYVCSTVRHLLFSLLRADAHRDSQHHILFFADYQHTSLADWDLSHLPENIVVSELSREKFCDYLYSSLRGKLCYFLAMRGPRCPKLLLQPLYTLLAESNPVLASALVSGEISRLWLFNERNKMARLLRLLIRHFSLIEDGASNYRLLVCPWWKQPVRVLYGLPARCRVLGEEGCCDEIQVLHPERLPAPVRHKGTCIDFLDSPAAAALVDRTFRARNAIPPDTQQFIVATQPFGIPGASTADKQDIYQRIVSYLQAQGLPVLLKVHPAEDASDYDFLDSSVTRIPGKIPLEAMLLGNLQPPVIVSIFSAAGMGLERYCRRIKLYEDGANNALYAQTLKSWIANPKKLDEVLQQKLPA